MRQQSRNVVAALSTPNSQPCQLFIESKINEGCWDILCSMNYGEIKASMGFEEDFCIFLEDYNGNMILCNNQKTGIGPNRSVQIAKDLNCGEIVT